MKHILPDLSFKYNELEPYIDAKTMEIHHTKHHQGYINNYVKALKNNQELLDMDVEKVLRQIDNVPDNIRQAVINNGGGYYNHRLFWTILSQKKSEMSQELLDDLVDTFGSLENFKNEFSNAAAKRFGSGWAWLLVNDKKELVVTSTANQDTPFELGNPILALDVWEHAYYLNYQNRRPEYIENYWHVVNWEEVSRLYKETK
ncbi:MAG: superoxide dismutase [Candidatus Izemoplasmatales bacterium]|nr:superoxide dismutase [Candidatus Izemoplasmatales bacterium]